MRPLTPKSRGRGTTFSNLTAKDPKDGAVILSHRADIAPGHSQLFHP